MAKRAVAPLSVGELLERVAGDPDTAVTFLSTLHRYPNLSELDRALRTDRRFRPPLARLVARLHLAKDALPSMFRFVPHDDPAFVPALLTVWGAWKPRISVFAAEALLAIGDRRGLEAMAALAGKAPPAFRVGPFAALMKLDVAKAHDRALAALARDPDGDWIVLGEVTKKHVAADARWLELARRSLEDPDRNVRARARTIVDEMAPARTRKALVRPAPAPENRTTLDAHRAAIAVLLTKLPRDGFTPARKSARKWLAELTTILGRLPAAVRAFYERIDAIAIERGKARDRFVVVSLAEVVAEARRWAVANAARTKKALLIEPFHWPVAPDGATKSGLSGGPAYGFEAPTDDDDPVLDAPKRPTFATFVTAAARWRRRMRGSV